MSLMSLPVELIGAIVTTFVNDAGIEPAMKLRYVSSESEQSTSPDRS